MTAAVRREPPNHRTLTCYTDYRCRLPQCVERYQAWERDRVARHADGTWDNLVDAAPVRDHILQLQKTNPSLYSVAKAAGVAYQSVTDIVGTYRPRRYRTSPEIAAKILAVTTEDVAPRLVPALGTHRRLQALVAAGWPLHTLDRRLGFKSNRMWRILAKDRVTSDTEALIAATYDDLRYRRPGRNGVPKHRVRWAREHAQARRWPTPAYWDGIPGAIDDPDFTPDYGKTRLQLVAEEAHWLTTTGRLDRDLVAKRLGVDRSYVDRALAAHPAPETEAAA